MQVKSKLIPCLLLATSIMSPFALANKHDDDRITTRVESLIQQEKDLPSNAIHVSTYDGVVKLSGNLDTMLQANRVVELAYSVENVNDVDSNISITNSEQYITDAVITMRARGKVMQLSRNGKIARTHNLRFETTNGTLHVFGNVGNKNDIAVLKNELIKLKGVESVKANVWVTK